MEIIEKKGGKYKGFVNIVKLFLNKCIKKLQSDSKKSVDDIIINSVNKDDFVVGTQDIFLKKRLKSKQIPIITIRQKKYLILEE